jgi:hypothetical protein
MTDSENGPILSDEQFHSHLRRRMEQRGITEEEVRKTIREGWSASDAKPGTNGRTLVFPYNARWEGTHYEEKEITVYYKTEDDELILLTAIARYGSDFPRAPNEP